MKIPEGMTEESVLATIDKIANRLAAKFKFGYNDMDDMKQQARMFAIEGMERYNPKLPLENFLHVHVRNRLFNFKRNKYERPDKPCFDCPMYEADANKARSMCLQYEDKSECALYQSWLVRNTCKKNLMQPIDLSEVVNNEHEKRLSDTVTPDDKMQLKELEAIIDKHLDNELKADYAALKNGEKLSRNRHELIKMAIKEIMDEHYT